MNPLFSRTMIERTRGMVIIMRNKRTILLAMSMIIFLFTPVSATNTVQYPTTDIYIQGECEGQACGYGYIINGTTFVPIRMVSESMGAIVAWNHEERTVSIRQVDNIASEQSEQLNNDEKTDAYDLERDGLISDIKLALELNRIYLDQLGIAKELYDETGKIAMIQQLQHDKMPTLKKTNQTLAEEFAEFNDRYKNRNTENHQILKLIDHLAQLTSSLDTATMALDRYTNHSSHPEMEVYIYEKKNALDKVEIIIREVSQ